MSNRIFFFFNSRIHNHKLTNNYTYSPRFFHRLDNVSGTMATFIAVPVMVDIAEGVPSLVIERLLKNVGIEKKNCCAFWV
jgi:hypothetical protein